LHIMKYVRSISLFFVYPLLCFALGFFVGEALNEKEKNGSDTHIMQENLSASAPPVIVYDEKDAAILQKEMIVQEQNVMNPSAVSQLEEEELNEKAAEMISEGYYVASYNDYVVVYHNDRKTIYLFTDMKVQELPVEVQGELSDGIYMKDEGELYDFLENYTS